MTLLLVLALVALLGYLLSRIGSNKTISSQPLPPTVDYNQGWIDFIAGYEKVATKPEQKAIVQRMLRDIADQGVGQPSSEDVTATESEYEDTMSMAALAEAEVAHPEIKLKSDLDNTSLLLYFGAFLFVAAVGLFIAFGGMSGGLRTLAVLLVMAVMYVSGIWLYRHQPRLQQAGLTFAGIGLVIAPLVGVAAYTYLFDRSHGYLAWLLTSILCLGLYAHALTTLKKPLISYLLIFTFLSLFESSIGIIDVPVYYFGWGLALVGILLLLVNEWKGYWPELRESSKQSAHILLPLSVLVALTMLQEHGAAQLGISLVLASAFYALVAVSSEDNDRSWSAVVSQLTAIAAVPALTYGVTLDWTSAVYALFVANMLQLVVFLWAKHTEPFWRNFASVLMSSSVIGVFVAGSHYRHMLASLLGVVFIGSVVWWHQRRVEAYALAGLGLLVLPNVYGQLVASPHLTSVSQTALSFGSLLVLLLVHLSQTRKSYVTADWHAIARVVYILGAAGVACTALFASPVACLTACVGVAATFVILAEYERVAWWAEIAGLVLLVPLARSWNDINVFLASMLVALVALMVLSLRYRKDTLRWASTAVWLLLPVALGRYDFLVDWTSLTYAWAYVLAMMGLIISRSIARGVIFMSSTSPLASFARNASLSYVVGYWIAATLAVVISLFSGTSQLHTSLILAVIFGLTVLLSVKIEKRDDLYALLPLLAQGIVLSIVRPVEGALSQNVFLLASIVLAIASYGFASSMYRRTPQRKELDYTTQTSLLAAFITPLTVFYFVNSTWLMAIGLLVAGLLASYHVRTHEQSEREAAGAIIAASVMWLLYIAGIRELQAYVHVVVFTLGFYAYWRAKRGETKISDDYVKATLAVATVPLLLQALGSQNSAIYGWWLLLEQITIMLIGMSLHKRFVTLWGLYVAFAAVLYQLRSLGYAALAALALFLIGLAVYQLQRQNKQ